MAWVQLTGVGAQDCLVTEARGAHEKGSGNPWTGKTGSPKDAPGGFR